MASGKSSRFNRSAVRFLAGKYDAPAIKQQTALKKLVARQCMKHPRQRIRVNPF